MLDTFRKRAAVIGFRCGVVFPLLENQGGILKESKASLDFALLIAEYALKYQTELFGSQLLEVNTTISDTGYRSRNKLLFDELPARFTFQMLQDLKPDARYGALREMIYKWNRSDLIVCTGKNQWEKKLCDSK